MNATPEQLAAINSQLQFNRRDLMRERNLSLIEETITEWESIRPKDQVSPEPTLDKIERAEFEAVMSAKFPEFCWASDFSQGAFEGWKAAKNQQTISA
jgi:hypothetical protein